MARVCFSIPDEIQDAFNRTFAKENKSAIIARLMSDAVEEQQLRERRAQAIDALLNLRAKMPPVNAVTLRSLRVKDRP